MASVAVGQIYSLFRPHLLNYSDRLSATLNEKQQFKTLLRELGDGGVDLALTAIGADAAIGVAKTTLKMGGAVRSYLNQRNLAGEAGSLDFDLNLKEAGESIVEDFISDLRTLCKSPPTGVDPIPAVIIFDDAQWIGRDATLEEIFKHVVEVSQKEKWPILVILTCWVREWEQSSKKADDSIIHRGDVVWNEIHLSRFLDASKLIEANFPSIRASEITEIQDKSSGNYGLLNEILSYLSSKPRLFQGRDLSKPLVDGALDFLSDMPFEQMVEERYAETPLHVRQALGLAALSGLKFPPKVVSATARALGWGDAERGLVEGERPYGYVGKIRSSEGEFRAPYYGKVARMGLADLVDEDEAEAARIQALREQPLNTDHTSVPDLEDQAMLEAWFDLIDRPEPEVRAMGYEGLAGLIELSVGRGDYPSARKLLDDWEARWAQEQTPFLLPISPKRILPIIEVARLWGRRQLTIDIAEFALDIVARDERDHPSPDSSRHKASLAALIATQYVESSQYGEARIWFEKAKGYFEDSENRGASDLVEHAAFLHVGIALFQNLGELGTALDNGEIASEILGRVPDNEKDITYFVALLSNLSATATTKYLIDRAEGMAAFDELYEIWEAVRKDALARDHMELFVGTLLSAAGVFMRHDRFQKATLLINDVISVTDRFEGEATPPQLRIAASMALLIRGKLQVKERDISAGIKNFGRAAQEVREVYDEYEKPEILPLLVGTLLNIGIEFKKFDKKDAQNFYIWAYEYAFEYFKYFKTASALHLICQTEMGLSSLYYSRFKLIRAAGMFCAAIKSQSIITGILKREGWDLRQIVAATQGNRVPPIPI